MTHRLPILIFLVVIAVGHLDGVAQDRRWLSYEPETVELQGRLILRWKYGPPNFGERPKTDRKVRVPMLALTDSINVRRTQDDGHNSQSVEGIRRIQLVVSDTGTSYRHLIGKEVVVKGTLFHAFSGHHYTDVLITVRSIEGKQRPVR
jgi:hypothetical protein